jgi:type IV pilus assembly protein PilB
MIVFDEEKQDKKILELRKQEEETLALTLSRQFGIGYIDLTTVSINSDALRVVSEEEARRTNVAVFDIIGKKIKMAVLAPEHPDTQALIQSLIDKGFSPSLYMASAQSLNKVWARYKDLSFSFETKGGALDISNDEITGFLHEVRGLDDVKKLIDTTMGQKQSYKISRLLEIIIAGALALKASDVHIEPEEKYVRNSLSS